MQIGMIGLGRMGINMAARLIKAGNECVVYDPRPEAVQELESQTKLATITAWSLNLPRRVAAQMPAVRPISSSKKIAPAMSISVAGRRLAMRVETSVRCM